MASQSVKHKDDDARMTGIIFSVRPFPPSQSRSRRRVLRRMIPSFINGVKLLKQTE